MAAQPRLDIATLGPPEDRDIAKIAKGWDIALKHSEERLVHLFQWDDDKLDQARRQGLIILETSCLFVHACIKPGQYKLPPEFWRILHLEYGIVVYPSAFTEHIRLADGDDNTFTSAYKGHIVMFGRGHRCHDDPPCPFAYLQEPPPKYEKLPAGCAETRTSPVTSDMAPYEKRQAFPPTAERCVSTGTDCYFTDEGYSAMEPVQNGGNQSLGLEVCEDDAETSSEGGSSTWGATEQDALDSQDGCAYCTGCHGECDSD